MTFDHVFKEEIKLNMDKILYIMCIGLICPCVSSAECCGDYEIDTTPTTVAIGRELNDASTYLRNALNAVPYVSGASVDVSGSATMQDICCNEEIISDGKKAISATITGSVSVEKTLSPIDLPFEYTVPGTTCTTGITIRAGSTAGITVGISLGITGETNKCTNTTALSGSANATGTVTAGFSAVASVEACGYAIEAKGNATASTGIIGGLTYSSNGASSSNIGFQDVTADIGISTCILTWNCTVSVARGYVLVKGNV